MLPEFSEGGKLPSCRKRSSIGLDVKVEIIKRSRSGCRAADIARQLALPASTVRSIIKNSESLLEIAERTSRHSSIKLTRIRSSAMEKMEQLLSKWLDELYEANTPVTLSHIRKKALSLYNVVRMEERETDSKETFKASRGWFHRFQSRYGFRNVRIQGEATFSTAALNETNSDGGYDPQHIFIVDDETGHQGKRKSLTTYIPVNEEAVSDFNVSEDNVTVLLTENRTEDGRLTTTSLRTAFDLIDQAIEIFQSEDPVVERSDKVACDINDALSCYRELYEFKLLSEKQKSSKRRKAKRKPKIEPDRE